MSVLRQKRSDVGIIIPDTAFVSVDIYSETFIHSHINVFSKLSLHKSVIKGRSKFERKKIQKHFQM